ncbi:MAG TPA: hypothetical protein VGO21_01060 [Candidatus Paceibacterota bacterium]|jgi:hypothetical protein|nr:hypothetical protein [Candidatus Paceibacterota bacterium]
MKKTTKNKKVTINGLAIMVAEGFNNIEKRLGDKIEGVEKKGEENAKDIRKDILNLGDRFVSYHAFDSLARRVKVLESKKK